MLRKQHLYLVLDDWEDGYSIHKIDVGDLDPDDTDDLDQRARPLPDPPLARVEAERNSATLFVALGTKILAMLPSPGRAALALDTRTTALPAGPLPQANERRYCPSAFVALYSMDKKADGKGKGSCTFEVLRLGSPPTSTRSWSWSRVPSPPPFEPLYVACYAVHPDGRTIFFSVAHSDELDPLSPGP